MQQATLAMLIHKLNSTQTFILPDSTGGNLSRLFQNKERT